MTMKDPPLFAEAMSSTVVMGLLEKILNIILATFL